jgi:hypothetical protein
VQSPRTGIALRGRDNVARAAASWLRSIDPVRLGDALAFLAASLFCIGVVGVVLSTVY